MNDEWYSGRYYEKKNFFKYEFKKDSFRRDYTLVSYEESTLYFDTTCILQVKARGFTSKIKGSFKSYQW